MCGQILANQNLHYSRVGDRCELMDIEWAHSISCKLHDQVVQVCSLSLDWAAPGMRTNRSKFCHLNSACRDDQPFLKMFKRVVLYCGFSSLIIYLIMFSLSRFTLIYFPVYCNFCFKKKCYLIVACLSQYTS